MKYRHELKFLLSEKQMYIIEQRVKSYLKCDKNQIDGSYTITSVYFDDIYDSCLRENIEGYDLRKKYRIRIYDHNFECIKLEKKEKVHNMTKKTAVNLKKSEAWQLINDCSYDIVTTNDKLKELLLEMKIKGLMPKTVVEYDRSAYIYEIGNVRITFDKNIRATTKIKNYWQDDTQSMPLMQGGQHILEVKYDELLPSFIYNILDIGILQKSGFSKYAQSRKYEN